MIALFLFSHQVEALFSLGNIFFWLADFAGVLLLGEFRDKLILREGFVWEFLEQTCPYSKDKRLVKSQIAK